MIKLLEENVRKKFLYTGPINEVYFFFDMTAKAQTKAKINKWYYIKLKSFCMQKKPKPKQQQNAKAIYRQGGKLCRSYIG